MALIDERSAPTSTADFYRMKGKQACEATHGALIDAARTEGYDAGWDVIALQCPYEDGYDEGRQQGYRRGVLTAMCAVVGLVVWAYWLGRGR